MERDVTRPARHKKENETERDISKTGVRSRENIRGRENMEVKDF
jgi:hypothetical protein